MSGSKHSSEMTPTELDSAADLHTETMADGHATGNTGIPQMDVSTFSSQLFWLAVVFVAMLLVLSRFFMPRIQAILALRAERISQDLERAELCQKQASDAKTQYETARQQARDHAQSTMAQVHASVKAAADKQNAELDAIIKQKTDESAADLAKSVEAARQKLTPVAQEMTSLMVEKLVQDRPEANQVAAILEALEKQRGA